MSMPSGMSLPPEVARQMMAQQMAQQGPPIDEQRRHQAVQLAIASFNVEGNTTALNDESLVERAKAIEDYINGKYEATEETDEANGDAAIATLFEPTVEPSVHDAYATPEDNLPNDDPVFVVEQSTD